ncbi:MAG: 3-deoxy-7-phosphoheptulonate synthase [Phycisphaerae bacterium]|nr:3-deoxy-7-phosphoheptulonate synthase [Phycisphaerae bacterium]
MLVVMEKNATDAQIERVCAAIRTMGYEPHPMPGAQRTAVCITGNRGPVETDGLAGLPGIREFIRVSKPYKLVSREFRQEDTVITLGDDAIGGEALSVIAGPCSVESPETTLRIAERLATLGVRFFRAGAYKPRTSPYAFQGLGEEGLRILAEVRDRFGMRIVTEALDADSLESMAAVADIVQIGARNMHNTSLLKLVGRLDKPVLLKRGLAATLDELFMAAEYIMSAGNYRVILCERGIRSFCDHSRFTLDLAAVPAIRRMSHLPVLVDPSHAAGTSYMVEPLSLAAVACGASGLIVEVHEDPALAWSDGAQAVPLSEFPRLLKRIQAVRASMEAEPGVSEPPDLRIPPTAWASCA